MERQEGVYLKNNKSMNCTNRILKKNKKNALYLNLFLCIFSVETEPNYTLFSLGCIF